MGLQFREYDLVFMFDGYTVEATIHYSSKDYRIDVHKPYPVSLPGKHIMAMLPVVYVIESGGNTKYKKIDLKAQCIKDIKAYFSKPENYPDIDS